MSAAPIRIFLLDDHVIVRSGLAAYIEAEPDMSVASEAGSLAEAKERVKAMSAIDVAVVDLRLPDGTGIQFLEHLAENRPEVPALTLSVNAGENDVLQAVAAGAAGYLSKSADRPELIDAIRQIADGGTYFPAFVRRKLEQGHARPKLTTREHRILECIVAGRSNKEIASTLEIADITTRQHVSSILRKLGAQDRTQAAIRAIREGYVTAEE